eukprot:2649213-Amphidinium_carterae.1
MKSWEEVRTKPSQIVDVEEERAQKRSLRGVASNFGSHGVRTMGVFVSQVHERELQSGGHSPTAPTQH